LDNGGNRIDTGIVSCFKLGMTPEALDSLSKQELIALVLAQMEQIRLLTARVEELEARLNIPPKTPGNSSLPPSKGQKANRPEKAKKERKAGPV
jgi:transposase